MRGPVAHACHLLSSSAHSGGVLRDTGGLLAFAIYDERGIRQLG